MDETGRRLKLAELVHEPAKWKQNPDPKAGDSQELGCGAQRGLGVGRAR